MNDRGFTFALASALCVSAALATASSQFDAYFIGMAVLFGLRSLRVP